MFDYEDFCPFHRCMEVSKNETDLVIWWLWRSSRIRPSWYWNRFGDLVIWGSPDFFRNPLCYTRIPSGSKSNEVIRVYHSHPQMEKLCPVNHHEAFIGIYCSISISEGMTMDDYNYHYNFSRYHQTCFDHFFWRRSCPNWLPEESLRSLPAMARWDSQDEDLETFPMAISKWSIIIEQISSKLFI